MSEEEIKKLLARNIELSEGIYQSVEKQRKYRLWSLIITIVFFVIPLIIALVAIPWMISTIQSYYSGVIDL